MRGRGGRRGDAARKPGIGTEAGRRRESTWAGLARAAALAAIGLPAAGCGIYYSIRNSFSSTWAPSGISKRYEVGFDPDPKGINFDNHGRPNVLQVAFLWLKPSEAEKLGDLDEARLRWWVSDSLEGERSFAAVRKGTLKAEGRFGQVELVPHKTPYGALKFDLADPGPEGLVLVVFADFADVDKPDPQRVDVTKEVLLGSKRLNLFVGAHEIRLNG